MINYRVSCHKIDTVCQEYLDVADQYINRLVNEAVAIQMERNSKKWYVRFLPESMKSRSGIERRIRGALWNRNWLWKRFSKLGVELYKAVDAKDDTRNLYWRVAVLQDLNVGEIEITYSDLVKLALIQECFEKAKEGENS